MKVGPVPLLYPCPAFIPARQNFTEALPLAQQLFESRTDSPLGDATAARAAAFFGIYLAGLDRWSEAEPALLSAVDALENTHQLLTPVAGKVSSLLLDRYRSTNRPAEAGALTGRFATASSSSTKTSPSN